MLRPPNAFCNLMSNELRLNRNRQFNAKRVECVSRLGFYLSSLLDACGLSCVSTFSLFYTFFQRRLYEQRSVGDEGAGKGVGDWQNELQ